MSYDTTYPEYPGPGSGEPVTITHREPSTVDPLTSCCDVRYWYSDVTTAKGVLVDVVMTCAPKTAGGCGHAFWGMH